MNTPTDSPTLVVAARFAGPARTGNGGYTAGLLAGLLPADSEHGVQVTLRRPPPLETVLRAEVGDAPAATARMLQGDSVIADASVVESDITPVEAVGLGEACEAQKGYAGLRSHPFPTCFTCGPDRDAGDGLRLFPGPVPERRTACTWTPDASVGDAEGHVLPAVVWAALDCPGGWTGDLEGRPMVLGRITAQIDDVVRVGERHIVMGQFLRADGRKTHTSTTLYDSDGRVVARALHVWIAVDPDKFN